MIRLTPRQLDVYAFIDDYLDSRGHEPTPQTIAIHCCIKLPEVHRILAELSSLGVIALAPIRIIQSPRPA